jgi:DNA-binding transcriptional ArsR family regulator
MNAAPNLAAIGALIGHPARAVMLEALNDGRAWTANELAMAAAVTPQTASTHLKRLVEGGMLVVEPQGRHRYFRIASSEVAEALEALEVLATRRGARPGLGAVRRDPITQARTCYDHLAGRLGVALTESLVAQRHLGEDDNGYTLTPAGARIMAGLGIDLTAVHQRRRMFARKCLDWSERRHHLGGALGAALTERLFELAWLKHLPRSRAVKVTRQGASGLKELGLALDPSSQEAI